MLHEEGSCPDVVHIKGTGPLKPLGGGPNGGWDPYESLAAAVGAARAREPKYKPLVFCRNCRKKSAIFEELAQAQLWASGDSYGLILAENEGTAGGFEWHDITGERYQFPKNYRNTIRPGIRFIYYSGTRAAGGGRKAAQYFGRGVIGDVYPDPTSTHLPKSEWKWLADITDYVPFLNGIPLRDANGVLLELETPEPPSKNYWGIGVRKISAATYDAILAVANASNSSLPVSSSVPTATLSVAGNALMVARKPETQEEKESRKSLGTRRSGQAKVTGDAAEKLFFEFLQKSEPDASLREKIVWVAREGETPGFDIEDRRDKSKPVAYEVKGTTGNAFLSFELTENEMRVAKALGERYVLVLVAGCLGDAPVFEQIVNPAKLIANQTLRATPSSYRIERVLGEVQQGC
jgi:hypothetical protein